VRSGIGEPQPSRLAFTNRFAEHRVNHSAAPVVIGSFWRQRSIVNVPNSTWKFTLWGVLLGVPLALVVIPLLFASLLYVLILAVGLHLAIWCVWCLRGRDILVVSSDSPVWHDYIEQNVLPRLGSRAVVLNWSRRKEWRWSLARAAFFYFAGRREYVPLAVVFRPFRWTRTFRFWKPFRDYKHGRSEALQEMEREFFELTGQ